MTLSGGGLPVSFDITLYSYYNSNYYGEELEHLEIVHTSRCPPTTILRFENNTALPGSHTQYMDSVTLNDQIFYEVYYENNDCVADTDKLVIGFYFTQEQGVVGFQADSAMWVLQ